MSSNVPDMGSMAVTNAINPPELISSDSTQTQIPTPDQTPDLSSAQPQAAPQQAASDNINQTADPSEVSAPKPSLWKTVLMGALQGLAAGASTDTRGLSGAAGFAKGAGAGVNQVLNVQPAQQSAQQAADLQNAFHHAQLAQIQREMALAPKDKHEQYLDNAADTFNAMLKSGGAVPLTTPTDFASTQQTYQAATLKNPAMTYSIMPTGRDENGDFQYSAVQYPAALTQKDIVLTDPDGNKMTVPAGTKSSSVGMAYTNMVAKTLDRDSKEVIASQNNATKTTIAAGNNATKTAIASAKGTGKIPDMVVGSLPDGSQVAGNPDQLQQWGATGITKLPSDEAKKVVVARQMVAPNGLFHSVAGDLAALDAKGKLGTVASRWGDFMAGKVGSDPDFQPLRTDMGLLATALMQAHVGARGSADMLQHFESLADYRISDAATLRAALSHEFNYVSEKSMLPKQKAGQ